MTWSDNNSYVSLPSERKWACPGCDLVHVERFVCDDCGYLAVLVTPHDMPEAFCDQIGRQFGIVKADPDDEEAPRG